MYPFVGSVLMLDTFDCIEVTVDIDKPKTGKVGSLRFKIQSVADGRMVDAGEAVTQAQAGASNMDEARPIPGNSLVGAVDSTGGSMVQTFAVMIGPVLAHLEFIQTLGGRLSEVCMIFIATAMIQRSN